MSSSDETPTELSEPVIIESGYDPFRAQFTAIENSLLDMNCNENFERPNNKFLLICILRYYNNTTGSAWPSQQTLIDMTGLSRSTIHRATEELEHRGFLKVTCTVKDGQRHNIYRITNKVFATASHKPATVDSPPTQVNTTPAPPDVTTRQQNTNQPTKQSTNNQPARARYKQQYQPQQADTRPKPQLYIPPNEQPKFDLAKHRIKQIKQNILPKLKDPIPI